TNTPYWSRTRSGARRGRPSRRRSPVRWRPSAEGGEHCARRAAWLSRAACHPGSRAGAVACPMGILGSSSRAHELLPDVMRQSPEIEIERHIARCRMILSVAGFVAVYLSLTLVSRPDGANLYTMRPVYLAITGYLVGYLGEQRLTLESRVRDLEAAAERERIARSLHDGYVQALAGVNLRLGTCR